MQRYEKPGGEVVLEFQTGRSLIRVPCSSRTREAEYLRRADLIFQKVWLEVPAVVALAESHSRTLIPDFWAAHDNSKREGPRLSLWAMTITPDDGSVQFVVSRNHDFDYESVTFARDDYLRNEPIFLPALPEGHRVLIRREDSGALLVLPPPEGRARQKMRPIQICVETPHQTEIHALLAASDAYMAELYPAESNHMLDLQALLRPEVKFIVARDRGRAVGCGAIVISAQGWAEIKRMFVSPAARGQKLGKQLLQYLEELARASGVNLLRLETGVKQPEALALYRSVGFVEIGPFGAYGPDPLSVFMEKPL